MAFVAVKRPARAAVCARSSNIVPGVTCVWSVNPRSPTPVMSITRRSCDSTARMALPMPEACIGVREPGGKKARIGLPVST